MLHYVVLWYCEYVGTLMVLIALRWPTNIFSWIPFIIVPIVFFQRNICLKKCIIIWFFIISSTSARLMLEAVWKTRSALRFWMKRCDNGCYFAWYSCLHYCKETVKLASNFVLNLAFAISKRVLHGRRTEIKALKCRPRTCWSYNEPRRPLTTFAGFSTYNFHFCINYIPLGLLTL